MVLTNKQEEAVKGAVKAFMDKEKRYVIAGYAGTGKSTTVRAIVEALDIDEDLVCYATFTGKAAQVLQRKGNRNAMTLHKLLYESYPRPNGGFFHKPKAYLGYRVIVVDEVSMAPKTLMDLLFSHNNIFVICLGDPFQLPPIDKDSNNHLLDTPDIFLDEIMRQAAESEIIRVTMDIRARKPLALHDGTEVKIIGKNDINTGMLTWADQVLVGTNSKRRAINNQMREILGFDGNPKDGDKMICLRNYWDVISNSGDESLVNGSIGYLRNSFESFYSMPSGINPSIVDVTCGELELETGDIIEDLGMDRQMIITGGTKTLDWRDEYKLHKNPFTADLVPMEFEYGYAITTHRAQGSQWNNVLVVEEWFPKDKEEHARWLYTAATRAAEKLVIVKATP